MIHILLVLIQEDKLKKKKRITESKANNVIINRVITLYTTTFNTCLSDRLSDHMHITNSV